MDYINTAASFEEFIDRAQDSSVLAIDTEFIREKTYYPRLCLLQFATEECVAVVDPFEVKDLGSLAHILENSNVMKLFHAGSQDIEILYRHTGALPWPLFDTQVAAALLGHSHQTGLGSLVSSFLGVSLKKGDSFTDWSRRPLAESQIKYAADDVIYLPELYQTMTGMLSESGRLDWLESDFRELSDAARYVIDPYERYKRLKRGNQLNRRQLAAAREIAAWREIAAQERDIPRKWLLTDEQIVESCKREPRTIDELFLIRGIKDHLSTKDSREVVKLMKKGLELPEADLPVAETLNSNEPNVDSAIDLMLALTRLRAKENGIAMQTLASQAELAKVARGHTDCDILKGWRRKIIGDEFLELLDGKISLSLDTNELRVVRNV